MTDNRNYIDSKKYNDHPQQILNAFKAVLENKATKYKGTKDLSLNNAKLGVLFLNRIPKYQTKEESTYGNRSTFVIDSPRFNLLSLLKQENKGDFWNTTTYTLLEFLFGERMAPFIKKAWDTLPELMYQEGYDRRSFRSNSLEKIHFNRQLNFFLDLIYELKYDFSLEEYAIYSNEVYTTRISHVLAGAIDCGDEKITTLCMDAIMGRSTIAKPSRTIIKAMLLSHQPTCWTAVEKLLLSAQRQEGLRQVILESLDETSLGAMKHFIKVILEHNLTRFSSVIRAVDVWAGFGWEAAKESTVKRFLELGDRFLSSPEKISSAVESKDNGEIYMALWAQGVLDIMECTPLLDSLLQKDPEKISLALYFISQADLVSLSMKYGRDFIWHKDPIIACQAVNLFNNPNILKLLTQEQRFELFKKLEERIGDFPKKTLSTTDRVFSWLKLENGKEFIYDLMINLLDLEDDNQIEWLMPHFEEMSIMLREKVTRNVLSKYWSWSYDINLSLSTPISGKKRDFAFSILKDRSEIIKRTAINALYNAEISDQELMFFEELLKRKSADHRKLILSMLQNKDIKQICSSTSRLLQAKNEEQRVAGLDLLLWIKKNKPEQKEWLKTEVEAFANRDKISNKEELILSGLIEKRDNTPTYTVKNGFGLYNPDLVLKECGFPLIRTGVYAEETKNNPYGLSCSVAHINQALKDLSDLFHANENYEYQYEDWNNNIATELLGNSFTSIKRKTTGMTAEERFCNYPLSQVWRSWYHASGLTPKDLMILNLTFLIQNENDNSNREEQWFSKPTVPHHGNYYWQNPIFKILNNLEDLYPYTKTIDFLSDLFIEILFSVKGSTISDYIEERTRWNTNISCWRNRYYIRETWKRYEKTKKEMNDHQYQIYWYISQYIYLNLHPKVKERYLPQLYDYSKAYKLNLITKDTLVCRALKPDAVSDLTGQVKKNHYNIINEFDFLAEIADQLRERILDVELIRGDSSTPLTLQAQNIKTLYGTKHLVMILKALGNDTLNRGYIYTFGKGTYNKKEILSALLKRCHPSQDDNQKAFDEAIKEAKITDKRLCEAASYAPQWLRFVAQYLKWKEMESAVWWLHAHTNGEHNVQTESEIAKYSSVEITAFQEGAVDVDWFKEVHKALGKDKWKKLYDAAKYISDGNGHKRAMLYADVIQKKTKIKEITERINKSRNQDYLRVYGLVPLSKTNPEKDLLRRYQFLQQFKKESKQFGAQRQTSEATAMRIAMENLARTSGYPDPIRLQWAMESKEAQEIINNASDILIDDCLIKLIIDEHGRSSIVASKKDKKLKSIPAKHRKNKDVVALKGYHKTLQEQYRRTRKSLETAMIQGDAFSLEEMVNLSNHPVVAPMIHKLVITDGKQLGFWEEGKIKTIDNETFTIDGEIKIAHCVDLYNAQRWSNYQSYFFTKKWVQPFKQVFRELYVPTQDELSEQSISRRYAGHQIQPQKTVALLKGQQWTVDYEDGLQKVHHKENCIARMYALADWFSPADIEAPTIETVEFVDRKKGERIAFDQINQRTFSETMRDIDLVVSVAHVGETDPEASQSTVELRRVIAQETCRLFKLDNVVLSGQHAQIEGTMGKYSVHLGSGVCHKIAGSALSIIPVHSQHRGRMFLPFMDEDPKTAEILSKIMLLAKDHEIKDPTILEQI